MSTTRIKDLTAASGIADDDYIVVDGATNGTRKMLASDIGSGEHIYKFTKTIDSVSTNYQYTCKYEFTMESATQDEIDHIIKIKDLFRFTHSRATAGLVASSYPTAFDMTDSSGDITVRFAIMFLTSAPSMSPAFPTLNFQAGDTIEIYSPINIEGTLTILTGGM